MFNHSQGKLAPFSVFIKRLGVSVVISAFLIAMALVIGIAGYHWIADFSWVDSLLNASMILGGMGPVGELTTTGAKVFASIYALFCGVVFIGVMGVVISPILHRMLHRFHIDEGDIKK
jgi:predicted membrane-bound spermidine synthase